MIPVKHIDFDIPDCPVATPVQPLISSGMVVGAMILSFILLVAFGFLVAFLYEKRSDNRAKIKVTQAEAAAKVAERWTTCPTCKADFHPVYDPKHDVLPA